MALIAIGVSHQTASLDVRERLVINPSDLTSTLADIAEQRASGDFALSTAARVRTTLPSATSASMSPHVRPKQPQIGASADFGYASRANFSVVTTRSNESK